MARATSSPTAISATSLHVLADASEGTRITTPEVLTVLITSRATASAVWVSMAVSDGTKIIRSPTPAKEVVVMGCLTDSAEASKVRTSELSSDSVADMYTRLSHSENEGKRCSNGYRGVMTNSRLEIKAWHLSKLSRNSGHSNTNSPWFSRSARCWRTWFTFAIHAQYGTSRTPRSRPLTMSSNVPRRPCSSNSRRNTVVIHEYASRCFLASTIMVNWSLITLDAMWASSR